MPEYKALRFEVRDGVGWVTLSRPEVGNAINREMALELLDVSLRCDEDPGVRAVVLTGSGPMFCTGGDLKSLATAGEDLPRLLKELTTYFHAAVSRFSRREAPVSAAVNGTAAGAGMSLVCACDLAVAVQSARFVMAYTRAGLTPDGSGTYFLPRLVGVRRALELTLTNRMLSAQEALEMGIVNRVVPDESLASEVESLARQLAEGPTRAYGGAKRLIYQSWQESLEPQMEWEARTIADMARTVDGREGIAAFLEKRHPHFKGQ